jgi:hypothetical protein
MAAQERTLKNQGRTQRVRKQTRTASAERLELLSAAELRRVAGGTSASPLPPPKIPVDLDYGTD